MGYLKVHYKIRLVLLIIGLVTLAFGFFDIHTGEASRRGIDASIDERPISFLLTVGKKLVFGGGLVLIALTPLLGRTENDCEKESKHEDL